MNLRPLAAIALTVALATGTATAVSARVNTQPPKTVTTSDGTSLVVRSCVIRWHQFNDAKATPYLYVNPTHPCPGISDITVEDDGDVVVTPVGPSGFAPVLYSAASADETFAKMGVIAGASIGTTATIRFSRKGAPMRGDDPALATVGGNIWLLVVSTTKPVTDPSNSPSPSPRQSPRPAPTTLDGRQ